MTFRSGSRMNTETCPASPKLTGPYVITMSFALSLAIVAGFEETRSAICV
jgi:hypothetical protein